MSYERETRSAVIYAIGLLQTPGLRVFSFSNAVENALKFKEIHEKLVI